MNKNLADKLAATMTVKSHGILEQYTTGFNNLEMENSDGSVTQYAPPTNMRLRMTNVPAVKKDGEPVLMSRDEIVLCRLGLDRNGLTRAGRASLIEEDRAALEFYEGLDVLEFQARLEILYGKRDMVAPEDALKRRALGYIGPELEKKILDGTMDVMFVDEHSEHDGAPGKGRPQETSIDLYWLRRIIRKQRPGDKLDFGQYGLKLTGDISQTLAGDSRFITHVIFVKWPARDAQSKALDRISGRLGQNGRGYLIVLRMQDIRHAIETYMSQLVPYPEKTGTMHQFWLEDHPVPAMFDEPAMDAFLAEILAAQAAPADEAEVQESELQTAAPVDESEASPPETPPTEQEAATSNEVLSDSEPPSPEAMVPSPEAAPQAATDDLPEEVRALLNSTN